MKLEGIGASVLRKEDRRFITGKGKYTDDIHVPGEHFAHFVRSPYAHARVKRIDRAEAQAMPGVLAVLDGHQLVGDGIGNIICGWMVNSKDGTPMKMGAWSALATDVVRYVGDAVCVVVASTAQQARDAAEHVEIDYEELAVVVDVRDAMNDGAPRVHDVAEHNLVYDWEIGDEAATDAAFESAEHVVELELTNNRLVGSPMETRAAVAVYDEAEEHFTLYTTSQCPHVARLLLSAFYQIAPEHKLRVIAPDVGGGFGIKTYVYPEEIVCLWAARRVGVPVRWTSDRSEAFLTDTHGRDHASTARMAFDADHRITGFKVDTLANLGAYMSLFSSAVPTYVSATLLSGQYDIPAIYANVKGVYTNTVPVDAYRGAGRPEATYLVERMLTTAARQLGVDPAELRRKNFIRTFPHQTPVIMKYDCGDFDTILDAALEASDYAGFPDRKAAAAARGKLRGIGMSCYIEACGLAPSDLAGSLGCGVGLWESAEVRVNPAGTIEVLTGAHSHGQGHDTTFAQLVSDRFGVSIDSVQIVHGDTDKVQFGMGTYGSRSGAVGMSAVEGALDKVETKVKRLAAHLLEASEDDVDIDGGTVSVRDSNKKLEWFEVCLAAYAAHNLPDGMEPGLKEGSFYDPENFTFPAGCYVCEVEIDPDTGTTEIVQFVAADDFGKVINPMIVEGQVHGGLAQGIGQALMEQAVYAENGQLLAASYMDYQLPRAEDLPTFAVSLHETASPSNPLGIKGCGEAGAIGAPPAVINAMTDAIGRNDLAMPATPHRVWKALRQQRQAEAA